jgi:hypothetical protein
MAAAREMRVPAGRLRHQMLDKRWRMGVTVSKARDPRAMELSARYGISYKQVMTIGLTRILAVPEENRTVAFGWKDSRA